MSKELILEKIRNLILDECALQPEELDNTTNIFEEGLVDSLFVVTIVVFLEKEFDCLIDS
jgi:acyl carrier protein